MVAGTTPVLNKMKVKDKAKLRPINYTEIDVYKGYENEPSNEQI